MKIVWIFNGTLVISNNDSNFINDLDVLIALFKEKN
jgi:hypothetical protein